MSSVKYSDAAGNPRRLNQIMSPRKFQILCPVYSFELLNLFHYNYVLMSTKLSLAKSTLVLFTHLSYAKLKLALDQFLKKPLLLQRNYLTHWLCLTHGILTH